MSDELKNKFRNYEASVSDEHIEARWQAIRPLLPAEDRRKAVILPLFTGRRLMVAFLILTALSITIYLMSDRTSSMDGVSLTRAPRPAAPASSHPSVMSSPKANRVEPSAVTGLPSSSTALPAQDAGVSFRLKTKAVIPAITSPSLSSAADIASTSPADGHEDPAIAATGGTAERAGATAALPDTSAITADNLTGVQWKPDPAKYEARTKQPVELTHIKASLSGRTLLEAYAGATRYMHRVKYEQRTGYGFVAGITHHTKLKGRFFLPLQVSVTGPQQISESEFTELVPLPVPATSGLTTTASGNQQYEKLVHTDRTSTSLGFQAALGLGYRMMASRNFTVSVIGMAEVNTYEFRSTRVTTSEDGSTTTQQPAPTKAVSFATAQTTSPVSPPRQVTYALVPCLHLSYKLAPRWSLTGRGAWHYSPFVSKSMAPEFYAPSRGNLDLCAGIGFRW